jgi:site-specific recombinase XerD
VDPNELTLASYERNLRLKNRSPKTVIGYLDSLGQLAAFHDGQDLLDLDRKQLEDFLLDITDPGGRGLTATTAMVRYRDMRAFYNWAVAEELIDASPMARVPKPTVVDDPPAVVPDDDLRQLLAACAGKDFDDRRDTAIIRLWCEPGSPRAAEMAGLTVEAVDLRHDQITMRGKGGKLRTVPFGAATGQAIDRYLRARRGHRDAHRYDRLWLGSRGKPLSPSGLYQMLERRCAQAGLDRIHPHQLRHTAAHVWADADGSEADAMALFGWTSPEMPRRYGRSAQLERAQRAARRRSLGDRL